MRSIFIIFLVSMLLVPEKSLVTSSAYNCISLKIQFLFLIVGVVFLSFISIYGTYRYKKQETMSENNRQKAGESKNLYATLNGFVVKQQLYLNPDLSRDNLTYLIHLNKNYFAQMLQQYSGFKLAGYLNNLRIEYAILLLKEDPDHTIQATATASGFNNMSTFYSLFKKRWR